MKNVRCFRVSIKRRFLFLVLLLVPMLSIAQESGQLLQLTLEKARSVALENNPEVKAASLDASISTLALAEAKLKRLPQLYTDFNLQRNLIIPVTPVPANAFDPSAPEAELRPLKFTTEWTSNAGINASFELFNPQNRLAVKEAEIRERIARLENDQRAGEIAFDVSSAYIAALIASEQLRLAQADTLAKSTLLKMSREQFEQGRLLLSALNEVKASRNNTLTLFDEARNIYLDAKDRLLNAMGFAPEERVEIEFADNLESLFESYRGETAIDTLNSFTLNKQIQEDALIEAQIKATANGFWPSLTLNGYFGANYFDNNFEILKSSNWNGNSFVNLGVRLPLTEGLQRQKAISQLRLQRQANELRYLSLRNANRMEYASAVREAALFERNFLRANENMALAESNLRLARQQFAEGRLTIGELSQVDYDYQKQKNTYLNVAYNYISAKLNIEKLGKN